MIRRGAVLGGLWATSLLLLLVGALAGLPLLVAAGSVGSAIGLDGVVRLVRGRPAERAAGLRGALSGLVVVEHALVLVLVLRDPVTARGADEPVVRVVGGAVVVLALLRVGWSGLQLVDAQLRRDRILVRDLEVPGAGTFAGSRLLSAPGLPVPAWPGLLLALGAAAAVAAGSSTLLVAASALSVVLTLVLWVSPLPGLLARARAPRGRAHRDLVLAALRSHAPEVVLYFGGGPGSVYAAGTWLRTLEHVRQPAFVLLRDPASFERLAPTSLPVLYAPGRGDVFGFSRARCG